MTTPYIEPIDVLDAMPLSVRPDPESDNPEDVAKIARLASLCVSTAEMIDAEIGYDFRRHPEPPYDAAATETWLVDGGNSQTIHLHRGVVSLELVEYRWSTGSPAEWTEFVAGDWELVSMYEDEGDRPFDHLRRTVGRWPAGQRNLRLTGVRGWEDPPARLLELNAAWVRQHVAAGDSYSGAAQVPDGFMPPPRLVMPDDVRIFLTRESARYRECYT